MPSKRAKDRPVIDTVKWKGIPISLEYVKGQMRHQVELPLHYGFFPGSITDDEGEHIDVFVGEDPYKVDVAFIINQMKQSGGFDEHKVVIGPSNAQDAKKAYLSCYGEDFGGFGSITAVTPYQLQWWLDNGDPHESVFSDDFLPGGRGAKRAAEFVPDYTPADLHRFGLLQPIRKTAWLGWYENYCLGIRTPNDEQRIAEWKNGVRKHAMMLTAYPSTDAMEQLVRYGVDPFPLVPRQHQQLARQRIAEVWSKYADDDRKPIVAIDLDGTLCENLDPFDPDQIGPVKREMVLLVNGLKQLGCTMVIWTVRDQRVKVSNHLRDAGVKFDYINDSPFRPESSSRKIYADVYLDDKAVRAEGPVAGQLKRILDILRVEGKLK